MRDVLIHRCTVRVVRRDGWSWGEDPRRLMRHVVAAIPHLIADRLAHLLADVPDGAEIATPLAIHVPLRLHEIRATASTSMAASDAPALEALGARIEQALQEALRAALARSTPEQKAEPELLPKPVSHRRQHDDPLYAALLEWTRSGVLRLVLNAAGEPVAEQWLAAILRHVTDQTTYSPAAAPRDHVLETTIRAIAADLSQSVSSRLQTIARELLDRGSVPEPRRESSLVAPDNDAGPDVAGRADGDVTVASLIRPDDSRAVSVTPDASREPALLIEPPVHAQKRRPLIGMEVHVPTALPWLLLVVLHRFGYLSVLRSVLDLARQDRADFFGAALALKLTESSERHWKKSSGADRLASAFTAQRDPVSKPDLHRFARAVAGHCALLDGCLTHAVMAGRSSEPWIVGALPGGPLVALDPEGCFPVCWGLTPPAVATLIHASRVVSVVVPQTAASPQLFDELGAARIRFLTSAPPLRDDRWFRIVSGPHVWWSNSAERPSAPERRQMAAADDPEADVPKLLAEFGQHRQAMPLDADAALERSVTFAITLGLGTMAWELWQTRESTTPLLALSRLEGLDARVRFSEHTVRVVLPLGKRHRDLYAANLLASVPGVPWLDGRILEFSGG